MNFLSEKNKYEQTQFYFEQRNKNFLRETGHLVTKGFSRVYNLFLQVGGEKSSTTSNWETPPAKSTRTMDVGEVVVKVTQARDQRRHGNQQASISMRRPDLTSPTFHKPGTMSSRSHENTRDARILQPLRIETETSTGSQIDSADNAARRVTGNPCIMP